LAKVDFKIDASKMLRGLRRAMVVAPQQFADALVEEGLIEVAECQAVTPVDTGNLRDGIHLEGPMQEGNRIYVLVATDPAQDDYALIVHEDLDAFHAVGGPKYIENPLRESAPYLADRVARRLNMAKMFEG